MVGTIRCLVDVPKLWSKNGLYSVVCLYERLMSGSKEKKGGSSVVARGATRYIRHI